MTGPILSKFLKYSSWGTLNINQTEERDFYEKSDDLKCIKWSAYDGLEKLFSCFWIKEALFRQRFDFFVYIERSLPHKKDLCYCLFIFSFQSFFAWHLFQNCPHSFIGAIFYGVKIKKVINLKRYQSINLAKPQQASVKI